MSSNSRWLAGVVFAAVVGAVVPAQGYYPGGMVPLICPVAGGGINSAIDGMLVDVDQDGDDDFVGRMGIPAPFVPILSASIGVCKSVGGTLTAGTCFPTAGQIPTTLAAGDLNGDGFPDLVVTCAGPPSVLLVLLNDGTGGFPSVVSTPLATGHYGVFVARVNADTIPDVILTSPGALGAGGPTLILLGTGTGTLGTPFAGPTTVTGNVIVQDDDLDGDDDLHEVTGGVFTTYRNSLGTFSTIPRFNVSGGLPVFADFNLDGNLDAAVIGGNVIVIAFGNGAGAFAVTPAQTLPAGASISRAFVADFDGDGDKDLVLLAAVGANYVASYSQNVAATFPNTKQLALIPTGVMVGDVTADGIADAVLQLPAGWSLFAGAAGRGLPHLTQGAISGGSGKGFGVADLNGNGWTDVVVSQRSPATGTPTSVGAAVALNVNVVGPIVQGGGAGPSAGEYLDFALGDWNGDSIVDVLAARANSVELSLSSQAVSTFFGLPVFTGTGIASVAAGDVNGDGKFDAIINQSTNVTVIFGTGTGTFTGSAVTPVCPNPVMTSCSGTPTIAVADLNVDGFLDLVVVFPATGVNPPNFSAYLGNGTGTFSPAFTAVCGGSTWRPALDDVNGDGVPDFVLSTTTGGLEVRFGLGGGAFAPSATYPIVWPASAAFFGGALAVGDINDDGLPDAALAGGAVFLNDGSGGFVQHEILPIASVQTIPGINGSSGVGVAFAQVSFDLKPDLVFFSTGWPANMFTVFRNVTPCSGTGYTFGLGCPGSGGFVPKLSATGCASPGGGVTLQVRDALGGAQTAALAVGPGHPLISPLIPGCSVLLQLVGSFVMPLSITGPPVAGQGRSSLPVFLPPSIPPGTWVTVQAAILDPAAPLGWSATNALSLVIQ